MKRLFALCTAAALSMGGLAHAQTHSPEIVQTGWSDAIPKPDMSSLTMPKMPRVAMPDVSMPDVSMPRFSMPRMSMPRMPQLQAPRIQMPSFRNTSSSWLSSMGDACGAACGACGSVAKAACGGCCPSDECCEPPEIWEHQHRVFGSFLYLSPRGVDTVYATKAQGTFNLHNPIAPSEVADPTYSPGFKVGGAYALDCMSSIVGTYWLYDSSTNGSAAVPGGMQQIIVPETLRVTNNVDFTDAISTDAKYDIDFRMADLEHRKVLCGDECHVINRVVGVRYANLEQDLRAEYQRSTMTTVNSEIDFAGIGPRFGLSGEWASNCGFYYYGEGFVNILAGQFTADYRQSNPNVIQQVHAGVSDDRFVPQLELELGLGWRNRCGNIHLRAGYYMNHWFNAITTPGFIDGVQAQQLDNLSDTISFDGLTASAEVRF
ncbi:MAG: Lpg1974 family pore-forming outer membrane protein [Planctomycetota bacterium]|jgi:hypothetical protein